MYFFCQSIWFCILPPENIFLFELCPNKVGFFYFLGFFKPKSFFHQRPDKITIVSSSYKNLKRWLILSNIELSVYFMSKIYHEKELFVFVYFLDYWILVISCHWFNHLLSCTSKEDQLLFWFSFTCPESLLQTFHISHIQYFSLIQNLLWVYRK